MKEQPALLVITGATATGKSELALRLAEQCGGEIVSADSMQLYCGLDIGTAKPTAADRTRVPHHLIDVLDIAERADVFGYCRRADAVIADVLHRGKRPVLCGGTGFYIRSLLYSLDDLPADTDLRRRLDAEFDSDAGEKELHKIMAELDPAALARFGKNRRKLLRALEVLRLTGRSILALQSAAPRARYSFELRRVEREREELKRRIELRTRAMLDSGWIEETREMVARGLLTTPTAHQALGYPLIAEFLEGRLAYDELAPAISTATWQFARRQLTYFRHQLPPDGVIFAEGAPRL